MFILIFHWGSLVDLGFTNQLKNTYDWGKHYIEVLDNIFDGNIGGIFNGNVIWDVKWYNITYQFDMIFGFV